MAEQGNILLMTPNASVVPTVARSLHGNGYVLCAPATSAGELQMRLMRESPPFVLVDLDPHPRQTLSEIEQIIERFPASRFVALAEQVSNELLLEAMHAGLRRVIAKRSLDPDLHGALDRLNPSGAASAGAHGEVLTVLSASGGCGATTVAINVARELAAQSPAGPTLLVDLDSTYGAASTILGIEPRYGLDQVLGYTGSIDTNLLSSTATTCGQSLHVLASSASVRFASPEPMNLNRMPEALRCAQRAYRHTVVDAPRAPMETAAMLANVSARTIVLLQLTVKDIRTARAIMDALATLGVAHDSILPVVNRFVKRSMIGLDEAKKALGVGELLCIRNDYAAAIDAVNFGKPLAESSPRSVLRRDLQELLPRLFAHKQS